MRIQKQKFLHKPEDGIFGDCFRTCLAVLMGVDAKEVPHFLGAGEFDQGLFDGWMETNGLHLLKVIFPGTESMQSVMISANVFGAGLPYILSGYSRTPSNHCVVAQGDEIVCDPSITDSGIVGPMRMGGGTEEWWVEWLVRKL